MRIGVDIGGTKIIGALIDESGRKQQCFRLQSKAFSSPKALAQEVGQQVAALLDNCGMRQDQIEHFGIGIPGTADWERGTVVYSPNLLGENVTLADYIENEIHMRPTIVQDSWAGAYAEYLFGQQKKYADMLCLTLGTGIGCGIIQNGKVYAGPMRAAGEIGHVSIDMHGRPCSCGRRGCLETYASGVGIYHQAMELFPEKLSGRTQGAEAVFELADAGDNDAQALLQQAVERLAFGLANFINITACNQIFISGGLSCREKHLIAPLSDAIRRLGYPAWSNRFSPAIQRAALGSEAPLIGAAFLKAEYIL